MATVHTRFGVQRSSPVARGDASNALWWVALIGMFFPPALFQIGALNFTAGRLTVALLLIPSLLIILKGGRSSVTSDFFAGALAFWIIVSSVLNGGFQPYVVAEAL